MKLVAENPFFSASRFASRTRALRHARPTFRRTHGLEPRRREVSKTDGEGSTPSGPASAPGIQFGRQHLANRIGWVGRAMGRSSL